MTTFIIPYEGEPLIKAKPPKTKPIKQNLGSWNGLPIIAIGKYGGKIVGYDAKGKPIYTSNPKAKKLADIKKQEGKDKTDLTGEWLLALGISNKIDGDAVYVQKESAELLKNHFPTLSSQKAGGAVKFTFDAIYAHVGEPLTPHEDDKEGWAASMASGEMEDDPFPDLSKLKEIPAGKFQGSAHHGVNRLFVDPSGQQWIFKDADIRIARAEEAAARIGRLLMGNKLPPTKVVEIEGELGALIKVLPGNETPKSMPGKLLSKYRKDIAQHFVVDWLVSNHDSHGQNFLENEGQLNGFDKGQAWKFFGKDKLDHNYSPNPDAPIYRKFWNAVQTGLIDVATLTDALGEVLDNAEKISPEQFRAIIAPYVGTAAGAPGATFDPEARAKAMTARLGMLREDLKAFLANLMGKTVPIPKKHADNFETMPEAEGLEGQKLTIQVPDKPQVIEGGPKAPVDTSEAKVPGWPATKGKVTIHHPGQPSPGGKWPQGYPGPGFSAAISYKKQNFSVEFGAGPSGEPQVDVYYPDGTKRTWPSPNAASESMALYVKGLPMDMSSTEKQKNKISLPAKKFFGITAFKQELAHAHTGEVAPSSMTPKELEDAGVVPENAPELTIEAVVSKWPDGTIEDWDELPAEVKEAALGYYWQIGTDYPAALPPGLPYKVTEDGKPTIYVAKKGAYPGTVDYVAFEWEDGKLTTGVSPSAMIDTAFSLDEDKLLKTVKGDLLQDVPQTADEKIGAPPAVELPKEAKVPADAPKHHDGPLAPGTSITVQKKFPWGKGKVMLVVGDDGMTFQAVIPDAEGNFKVETFKSISEANNWVTVNQKGYPNVEAYKAGTGKKKPPSNGWAFWGLKATKKAPPKETVPKTATGQPAMEELKWAPPAFTLANDPEGTIYVWNKGDSVYKAKKVGPDNWELSTDKGKVSMVGDGLASVLEEADAIKKKSIVPSAANWETMPDVTSAALGALPVGTNMKFTGDGEGYTATKYANDYYVMTGPSGEKFEHTDGSLVSLVGDESGIVFLKPAVPPGFEVPEGAKTESLSVTDVHPFLKGMASGDVLSWKEKDKDQVFSITKLEDGQYEYSVNGLPIHKVATFGEAYNRIKWNETPNGFESHKVGAEAEPELTEIKTGEDKETYIAVLNALPDGTEIQVTYMGKVSTLVKKGSAYTFTSPAGNVSDKTVEKAASALSIGDKITHTPPQVEPGKPWFLQELEDAPMADIVAPAIEGYSDPLVDMPTKWDPVDFPLTESFLATQPEGTQFKLGGAVWVKSGGGESYWHNIKTGETLTIAAMSASMKGQSVQMRVLDSDAYIAHQKEGTPLPEKPASITPVGVAAAEGEPKVDPLFAAIMGQDVTADLDLTPSPKVAVEAALEGMKVNDELVWDEPKQGVKIKATKMGDGTFLLTDAVSGTFMDSEHTIDDLLNAPEGITWSEAINFKLTTKVAPTITPETLSEANWETMPKYDIDSLYASKLNQLPVGTQFKMKSESSGKTWEATKDSDTDYTLKSPSGKVLNKNEVGLGVFMMGMEDVEYQKGGESEGLPVDVTPANVKDVIANLTPGSTLTWTETAEDPWQHYKAVKNPDGTYSIYDTFDEALVSDLDALNAAGYVSFSAGAHDFKVTLGIADPETPPGEPGWVDKKMALTTEALSILPVGAAIQWWNDAQGIVDIMYKKGPNNWTLASLDYIDLTDADVHDNLAKHLESKVAYQLSENGIPAPKDSPQTKKVTTKTAIQLEMEAEWGSGFNIQPPVAGNYTIEIKDDVGGPAALKALAEKYGLTIDNEGGVPAYSYGDSWINVPVAELDALTTATVPPQTQDKPAPKPKKPKKAKAPKKTAEQKAKEKKAKEVAAWLKKTKPVTDAKAKTVLAHFQTYFEFFKKDMKAWARDAGKGYMLLGSPKSEFAALMADFEKTQGLKTEKVDTPLGTFWKVKVNDLAASIPGNPADMVTGPDGKEYPKGTTWEETQSTSTVAEMLTQEPGFHKITDHNTDPETKILKVAGTAEEKKQQLLAMAKKYNLKHTGAVAGSANWLLFVKTKQLQDVGHTETVYEAKVPPQPNPFISAPLPTSATAKPGQEGTSNRADLAAIKDIEIGKFGHSIRMGAAGMFKNGQIHVRKVKAQDGNTYYEVRGELETFDPNKSLLGYSKMSLPSAMTRKNPGSDVYNLHSFEGGIHDESGNLGGTITSISGYAASSPSGTEARVYTGEKAMENVFTVRIPENRDVEGELSEAFTAMGLNPELAMRDQTPEDERVAIKSAIVKSMIGPKAWMKGNSSPFPESKRFHEPWLDEQLKEYGVTDEMLASARFQTTFDNHQSVVFDDPKIQKSTKAKFVYMGMSEAGVFYQILDGSGWSSRTTRYLNGIEQSGASAESDMERGGANGVFCRIGHSGHGPGSDWGLKCGGWKVLFNKRVLDRADWRFYRADSFGETRHVDSDMRSRHSVVDSMAVSNEILFDEGIAVSDIGGILAPDNYARQAMITKFKNEGITELNGIPMEELIQVQTTSSRSQNAKKFKGLKKKGIP